MEFGTTSKNLTNPSRTETVHSKLEKFQELMLKIVQTRPNQPLTESNKSIVQYHLHELSSHYKTPDHPPYHEMIEMAIRELNEKGGSGVETISKVLKNKHNSLPWAHLLLLKHHLVQLCDSGDIIMTSSDKYMLSGANPSKLTSLSNKGNRCLMTRRSLNFNIGMKEKGMCKNPIVEKGKHHQETIPSQASSYDIWAPRK